MTLRFVKKPGQQETEISILDQAGKKLPLDRWALDAPENLLPGVDLVQRLIAAESAIEIDDIVLVKSSAIASLSQREADTLSLESFSNALLKLTADGLVTQPHYKIIAEWRRSNGQPVIAERIGAWLRIGNDLRRIPEALYIVIEAVDGLNNAVRSGALEDRMKALAELKAVLPEGPESRRIEINGLAGAMTIAIADAFSVDLLDGPEGEYVVPKLHGANSERDELLLSADGQNAFEARFFSAGNVQPIYPIGNQIYVVLQPLVRKALAEVRKLQGASTNAKRAFVARPRAYLREIFGDDIEESVLESIFRETSNYSQRVLRLGLWVPRVVPWIKLPATDWLGSANGNETSAGLPDSTMPGLVIGDTAIPLSGEDAAALREKIQIAIKE